MAALIGPRRAPRRPGTTVSHPLAANSVIHQGALACLNAAGFLVPGSQSVTLVCVGIADHGAVNSGGGNGDVRVDVRRDEAWRFDNDAGDPVGRQHIGRKAYMTDDHTLAASAGNDGSGSPTRSPAGTIIDVDDDGVWIIF